jgi:hypothetical protein
VGFRPELNLREILQEYEVFGGTPRLRAAERYPEAFSVLEDPDVSPDPPDEPLLRGRGSSWCSSETALDLFPRVCWDVNGYYRSLGVHWRAPRKELREAYQVLDGQASVWLTYVLRQLLDPAVRRAYDQSPLGEPFLDDDFVQEGIKRKAYEEAYRRTMDGVVTERDEVLDEWGLTAVPADNANPDDRVDTDAPVGQDEPHSQETWEYSFYLWRTILRSLPTLQRWQELILRELSVCRSTVRFAVGMIGKEQAPYVLGSREKDFIIFLNEDCLPTAELAAQAVHEVLHP